VRLLYTEAQSMEHVVPEAQSMEHVVPEAQSMEHVVRLLPAGASAVHRGTEHAAHRASALPGPCTATHQQMLRGHE